MMTTQRTAMQTAIEDFLSVLDGYPEQLVPINHKSASIAALRAALSEPVDEPERSIYLSPEELQALQLERNALCRDSLDLIKVAHTKPKLTAEETNEALVDRTALIARMQEDAQRLQRDFQRNPYATKQPTW